MCDLRLLHKADIIDYLMSGRTQQLVCPYMVSPLRVAATKKTCFPEKEERAPVRAEVTFILMSKYS